MQDPKSKALEKAADKLLKAYEAVDKWNSNRKEKQDVTKKFQKTNTKTGKNKAL